MQNVVQLHHPSEALSHAAYDPKKGWNSAAQPVPGMNASDYHDIAQEAAVHLAEQTRTFCEEHGFSYIEIPYRDFLEQYERPGEYSYEDMGFREWLNRYCEQRNMNSNADLCIIQASAKELGSCKRKTGANVPAPDRNVDYLRTMMIALKKTSAFKNRQSLDTLGNAMKAIEEYPATVARKNYYYEPHAKTGFRGHKSLWVSRVPKGGELEGFEILSEIKIEHESQMDIDKLTRHFISLGRDNMEAISSVFSFLGNQRAGVSSNYANQQSDIVTQWGRLLYDKVFEAAGITDRFLSDRKTDKFDPVHYKPERWLAIINHIASCEKYFRPSHFSTLISAICSSEVIQNRAVPKNARLAADAVLRC